MFRGSLSLPKYSVYGSSNNISQVKNSNWRFAIQRLQFSFTKLSSENPASFQPLRYLLLTIPAEVSQKTSPLFYPVN